MKYRIVDTDNFGDDYPNEHFVGEPFDSKEAAEAVAYKKNKKRGVYSRRYWKVVPEDYKLKPGFEP